MHLFSACGPSLSGLCEGKALWNVRRKYGYISSLSCTRICNHTFGGSRAALGLLRARRKLSSGRRLSSWQFAVCSSQFANSRSLQCVPKRWPKQRRVLRAVRWRARNDSATPIGRYWSRCRREPALGPHRSSAGACTASRSARVGESDDHILGRTVGAILQHCSPQAQLAPSTTCCKLQAQLCFSAPPTRSPLANFFTSFRLPRAPPPPPTATRAQPIDRGPLLAAINGRVENHRRFVSFRPASQPGKEHARPAGTLWVAPLHSFGGPVARRPFGRVSTAAQKVQKLQRPNCERPFLSSRVKLCATSRRLSAAQKPKFQWRMCANCKWRLAVSLWSSQLAIGSSQFSAFPNSQFSILNSQLAARNSQFATRNSPSSQFHFPFPFPFPFFHHNQT